jgi:GTPase SAR1 family protein
MVILVIGAPGTGKTWLMKELINKFNCSVLGKVGMVLYHKQQLGKTVKQGKSLLVVGKYDGSTFEGSDKLSMAVMRDVRDFLEYASKYIVVAEGDRFTNKKFIELAKPTVICIDGDGAKGRKARGSNQTQRQIAAKTTQVSNLSSFLSEDYGVTICQDSETALKHILKLIK